MAVVQLLKGQDMERTKRLEQLRRQTDSLWRQISMARERGDWPLYFKLRRSWISVGRTYSELLAVDEAERQAQLTLVPHHVGRAHDAGVSGTKG